MTSIHFTLSRTQLSPPAGASRFWACAGGTGSPMQRLIVFQKGDFQAIDTTTWSNPTEEWANINDKVVYLDAELNGQILEEEPLPPSPYCQCSLFDFGYAIWLQNLGEEVDLAVDYYNGVAQSQKPPLTWWDLVGRRRYLQGSVNFTPPQAPDDSYVYDPNDWEDTKGIQVIYTGDTIGTGNFGFVGVDEISQGQQKSVTNRFVNIEDNGQPFTLRVTSSQDYDVRVVLVDEELSEFRQYRPLEDELVLQATASSQSFDQAKAYKFVDPAPDGKHYALEVRLAGIINPKDSNVDWDVDPGPSSFSGSPNYVCSFPGTGSTLGNAPLGISLQSCDALACGNGSEEVELKATWNPPPDNTGLDDFGNNGGSGDDADDSGAFSLSKRQLFNLFAAVGMLALTF